jgi:hypothetical protein
MILDIMRAGGPQMSTHGIWSLAPDALKTRIYRGRVYHETSGSRLGPAMQKLKKDGRVIHIASGRGRGEAGAGTYRLSDTEVSRFDRDWHEVIHHPVDRHVLLGCYEDPRHAAVFGNRIYHLATKRGWYALVGEPGGGAYGYAEVNTILGDRSGGYGIWNKAEPFDLSTAKKLAGELLLEQAFKVMR